MSARKEKLFGLMTRVNGRGRLIPTPAPSNSCYTEATGGLGGPLLKTVHCIAKFNEPVTVTVTVTVTVSRRKLQTGQRPQCQIHGESESPGACQSQYRFVVPSVINSYSFIYKCIVICTS